MDRHMEVDLVAQLVEGLTFLEVDALPSLQAMSPQLATRTALANWTTTAHPVRLDRQETRDWKVFLVCPARMESLAFKPTMCTFHNRRDATTAPTVHRERQEMRDDQACGECADQRDSQDTQGVMGCPVSRESKGLRVPPVTMVSRAFPAIRARMRRSRLDARARAAHQEREDQRDHRVFPATMDP